MMIMMMMTVTENHAFILGSEFKYGAQVTKHALGLTNSTGILLKCDALVTNMKRWAKQIQRFPKFDGIQCWS